MDFQTRFQGKSSNITKEGGIPDDKPKTDDIFLIMAH